MYISLYLHILEDNCFTSSGFVFCVIPFSAVAKPIEPVVATSAVFAGTDAFCLATRFGGAWPLASLTPSAHLSRRPASMALDSGGNPVGDVPFKTFEDLEGGLIVRGHGDRKRSAATLLSENTSLLHSSSFLHVFSIHFRRIGTVQCLQSSSTLVPNLWIGGSVTVRV